MSRTTSADVYLDEPWVLLRWDPEHCCVFAEWRAFATSREFQGALTKALEVGREKRASSLVSDTRQLELVSDQDQWWIRHTWTQLAIEAGFKRIAVVMARHGLGKMAIDGMFNGQRDTGSQLMSRKFDSLAEALAWVAEL